MKYVIRYLLLGFLLVTLESITYVIIRVFIIKESLDDVKKRCNKINTNNSLTKVLFGMLIWPIRFIQALSMFKL